ncbi:MAG TPA: Ku protein [Pirellulales bacterium]|jgi:DNA end-binding protein Ku
MAIRSMWKGSIRFSLVTVPVQAFTAAKPNEGEVHLNQLHDKCHSRIRYKKTCPIHGEVPNDEIVTGYEYEKDHYVIVDRDEVEKAQADDRSITIESFISPEQIDPIYYDGRVYYLVPETPAANQPYTVLCQAMEKLDRCGVAMVVLHGKEQLLMVRPIEGVLTMMMLHYESQIRSPEAVRDEVPQGKVSAQELKLAQQLIDSSTDKKFDFARYQDRYTDRLKTLIQSKIEGKEIIEPPQTEEDVPIINLMDALRKSVQKTKQSPKAKQARKALSSRLSRGGETQRQRRRKTS